MILYGRNPVREALRGPRRISRVWATARAAREPWLAGVLVTRVSSGAEVARLCSSEAHQGICAEAEPYRYADAGTLLSVADPLIVALDEIQDPQNLGAICRSAECAGATGLVLPRRRSADVTPAVCKASAGAVEHLSIARVRNLTDFLADATAAGCWCYGTDAGARAQYTTPDYRGAVVCGFGSEGGGLRPRWGGACDRFIPIPRRGRTGSRNVGAALAGMLSQTGERRGRG